MLVYIYDGSLEGLFCSLASAIHNQEIPDRIVLENQVDNGLFLEKYLISTDQIVSEKFIQEILDISSSQILQNILLCHLSEEFNIELVMLDYLKLVFKMGTKTANYLSDETVLKVHKTCQKVIFESHRLKGLLRFRKLKDGFFYAPIEPDHNVLQLLAPHFQSRMGVQKWMIHDVSRNTGFLYNGKTGSLVSMNEDNKLLDEYLDEEELEIQSLWKEFYKTIAIAERKNVKLQRRCMPKRYWRYLVEKG